MFGPSKVQVDELKRFAYLSDREIRGDLAAGYIRDEDDYTANFTGTFRRNINCYGTTGIIASSLMLGTSVERKTGCDATIIITSNDQSKIVLFEAKYPRLTMTNYKWDYPQTASGMSHFSDQIVRQSAYSSWIAIFEMFYDDHPFSAGPAYLQRDVSSCVWHDHARSFDLGRTSGSYPWTTADLSLLLSKQNKNIAEIIESVCVCERGERISMTNPETIAREFDLPGDILVLNLGSSSGQAEG